MRRKNKLFVDGTGRGRGQSSTGLSGNRMHQNFSITLKRLLLFLTNCNNTEIKMDANISESFATLRTIAHLTRYFDEKKFQLVHFSGPNVY